MMKLPLIGKTVAIPETRQLDDLAQLLEKEGATTFRCPLVSIIDNPEAAPVVAWLHQLAAGTFDYLVLMTGEALRRLLGFADREGIRARVIDALGKTRKISRGPKPVQALREIGLTADLIAGSPTTAGVIGTLQNEPIGGKTVGVTLFGEPNPELISFIESAGATPKTVLPYLYAPAADAHRVVDLIEKMAAGVVDAIAFTSSPQVDRLWEVARQKSLEAVLRSGLERTKVAAVGPIVAETLEKEYGIGVDIAPERGFVMKNLVQLIGKSLAEKKAQGEKNP